MEDDLEQNSASILPNGAKEMGDHAASQLPVSEVF
jgi:hypothetical protein